jgi:hypothetical protein
MQRISIVVALLALAVGFGAGWLLRSETRGAPAAAPLADEAAPDGEAGAATLGDPEAHARRLEARLAAAEARGQTLAADLEQSRQRTAALEEQLAAAGVVSAGKKGPTHGFAAFDEALNAVNWPEVGDALAHLGPLLGELGDDMAQGKEVTAKFGEIQRWNGPLLTAALELNKRGLPGTSVNGSFTHPSSLVNMVAAALTAGGRPLDEAQSEQLGRIGLAFVAEDERRLAAYPADALAVQKLLDEARLKERFFAEVDRLLTPEQVELLHPPAVRGRSGLDLFSSGLVVYAVSRTVKFRTREDLAQALVAVAQRHFDLTDDALPLWQEAAVRWAQGFPEAWLFEPPDGLVRGGNLGPIQLGIPTPRLLVALEHACGFFRQVVERLPADDPLAARIRAEPTFPYPMFQP